MTLADAYPHLFPSADELTLCRASLGEAYSDYIAHVSPAQMAISLETSTYILWAAKQIGARTAIDFGSGFTSYVLRQCCEDVTSVDDEAQWLGWTEQFLERYGCNKGRLVEWDDFTDHQVDLVVYDFSSGEIRDANFKRAVGCIGPDGIGIMDDVQHDGHQQSMRDACRHYRYDLFGLQDWTKDWFNRYAGLVVRP